MKRAFFAAAALVFANRAFAADESPAKPQTINFFSPAAWLQMARTPDLGTKCRAT